MTNAQIAHALREAAILAYCEDRCPTPGYSIYKMSPAEAIHRATLFMKSGSYETVLDQHYKLFGWEFFDPTNHKDDSVCQSLLFAAEAVEGEE